MRRDAKRDANEGSIIAALEAAGCAVAQLGQDGVPDLLVSKDDVLHLLEVKNPESKGGARRGEKREKGHGVLTTAQVKWWASWRGKAPVIVTTASEAIAAVSAGVDGNRSSEGTPEALDEASRQATPSQGGGR